MADDRRRLSVTEAFEAVPRAHFLPAAERRHSASNVPLAIGHGQTNSQPSTVADMLELLEVRRGDRVLDLGSGSGWTTALLAVLVGEEGQVNGVERHRGLVESSQTVIGGFEQESARRIEVGLAAVDIHEARSGVLGLPDAAPFDRILVSAGAEEMPVQLVAQLEIGGIMVIPVQGEMLKVTRTGVDVDDIAITGHGRYRFVPLIRE